MASVGVGVYPILQGGFYDCYHYYISSTCIRRRPVRGRGRLGVGLNETARLSASTPMSPSFGAEGDPTEWSSENVHGGTLVASMLSCSVATKCQR